MNTKPKLDLNTIKKFTSEGRYNIDIPFNYLKDKIDSLIDKYGLELNPDFQRGHVWTTNQQISFVEYFLKGGVMSPIRLNHTDWGRYTNPVYSMVCVDGLQRLTALLLFLDDKLPIFGGYTRSETTNLYYGDFSIKININSLKTKAEVLQWYIDLNTGGTVHTEDEIDRVKTLLVKTQKCD